MKTINLSGKFKDLNGNVVEYQDDMATTLANMFAVHTENPAKCMTWATELIRTGSLSIDDIDLEWVRSFVTGYHQSNIIKMQLLEALKMTEEQ